MKIYNGWVLDVAGREWVIIGRQAIRKTVWYILQSGEDKRSIDREQLIKRMDDGSIKYIDSVASNS